MTSNQRVIRPNTLDLSRAVCWEAEVIMRKIFCSGMSG